MIARITGTLESIDNATALVTPDAAPGLTYAVLLPAFLAARLAMSTGQPVTLHTFEFYEAQGQGQSMLPRLAGFASPDDRAFFELLVTVKGIGYRKALRAMTLDVGVLAAAIADRDNALLQTLPEVGRRTAETITLTLRDKVDRFVTAAAYPTPHPDAERSEASGKRGGGGRGGVAREAMEALLQLGESRQQAALWIDRVMQDAADAGDPLDAQGVVQAVYRLKGGH